MSGLSTGRVTTTIRVKHLPLTRSEYVAMLKASFDRAGFPLDDASIEEEADQLLRLAAAFPTDRILEKRGGKLQTRG